MFPLANILLSFMLALRFCFAWLKTQTYNEVRFSEIKNKLGKIMDQNCIPYNFRKIFNFAEKKI